MQSIQKYCRNQQNMDIPTDMAVNMEDTANMASTENTEKRLLQEMIYRKTQNCRKVKQSKGGDVYAVI